MSQVTAGAARNAPRPRADAGRFDSTSIALHWLTLALVAGQFATAWLLGASDDGRALLTFHRSMGLATWTLVLARLVWRRCFAHLPPFPASMPKRQQAVAVLSEHALYALLLVQPITGLADTLFRGRKFTLFIWRAPALLAPDKPVFHALHLAHELGALALATLIGLHAAAALFHGLVLRDGVLQRMAPWTRLK